MTNGTVCCLEKWSQACVAKVIGYNKDNLGNEFKFRIDYR